MDNDHRKTLVPPPSPAYHNKNDPDQIIITLSDKAEIPPVPERKKIVTGPSRPSMFTTSSVSKGRTQYDEAPYVNVKPLRLSPPQEPVQNLNMGLQSQELYTHIAPPGYWHYPNPQQPYMSAEEMKGFYMYPGMVSPSFHSPYSDPSMPLAPPYPYPGSYMTQPQSSQLHVSTGFSGACSNTQYDYPETRPPYYNPWKPHMTQAQSSQLHLSDGFSGAFSDGLYDDPETRLLYEKAINKGSEIDRSVRVMLVGCFGQGKTTLARRLLGENLENIRSTDGIDIHQCISTEDASSLSWKREDVKTENNIYKRLASVAANLEDERNAKNEAPENTSDQILSSDVEMQISNSNNILVQNTPNDQATSGAANGRRNVGKKFSEPQEQPFKNENRTNPQDVKLPKEFRKAIEELRNVQLKSDKTQLISLWDFGGQYIYYATHQLFHSTKAVYLLVFNLSLSLEVEIKDEDYPGKTNCKTMQDYILFWMHSIHSFAGHSDGKEPVVVLVGTHRDKLQSDAESETYFETIREIIETSKLGCHVHSEHFAVSAVDNEDKRIDALRKTILDIGGRREQTLPAKWIVLDHKLQSYLQSKIISFGDLQKIDNEMEYPVGDEEELKLFLKYKHGKGIYFYFDEDEMSDQIVLKPQFVIDAFKCIITAKQCCQSKARELLPVWEKLTNEAILMPELLHGVWTETSTDFIKHENILLFMLKKHRIISDVLKYGDRIDASHLEPLGFYIVPSLLKVKDTHKVESFLNGKRYSTVSLAFSFHYSGISETVFHRLLAAAIGTWPILLYGDVRMLFDNVGIFELDCYHAALIRLQNCRIHLLVVSLCPEYNISDGKGDYFRRFAETVVNEVFRKIQNYSIQTVREIHEHSRSPEPYRMTIHCFNPEHKCEGSKKEARTLEQIQAFERDILPCPDNFSHSLHKRQIQHDWFEHSDSDEFPKRKLSQKEYSKLSQAIGEHWEPLGLQLGIHNVTIEHIKMQTPIPRMRIFEMFLEWDKQFEDNATFNVLVDEMKKLPQQSVIWDIVYNIKDGF